MSENANRLIYLNGQPVPVTEEVYLAWYRPIWRIHDFARRHGQCSLARWQYCEGDCGICRHKMAGDHTSLDELYDAYELEPADPRSDPESIYMDELLLQLLLEELDEIDPQYGHLIASMCEDGVEDRDAAERLGLAKSTYSDHKLKIRRELKKRRGR